MAAEAQFDTIAKHYDLLYGDRDDDLAMWEDLTDQVEGEILEVGCGTGRVMIPLLQRGHRVTGIEISPLALQTAQAKLDLGRLSDRASLHLADMRTFSLPQKQFSFAFLPINTFMHCQTTTDQQATLATIYHHLQPGGRLVVDLFHPSPQMLLASDGELLLEQQRLDELTGQTTQWFISRRLQLAEQRQEVIFILDEIDQNGLVRRETISFSLRYLHRFELTLLLNQAGFRVLETLGDYDQSEFDDLSPRIISIAEK